MTSIKYPTSVKTDVEKYAYLYRLQELLRLKHNKKGKEYREEKITEVQWLQYENNDFDPKSSLISAEICKYRELLKKDTNCVAKLTDIVV